MSKRIEKEKQMIVYSISIMFFWIISFLYLFIMIELIFKLNPYVYFNINSIYSIKVHYIQIWLILNIIIDLAFFNLIFINKRDDLNVK